MHLFLFTNSAQRELVSICTQSIRDCNKLSLHYSLGNKDVHSFKHSRFFISRAQQESDRSILIQNYKSTFMTFANILPRLKFNQNYFQNSFDNYHWSD